MHPKRGRGRLGDTKDVRAIFWQAVVFPAAGAVPGTSALGPQVLTRKLEVPATQGRMGPGRLHYAVSRPHGEEPGVQAKTALFQKREAFLH